MATSSTARPGADDSTPAARPLRTANLRSQLADSLRERLRGGEWPVGSQLPTEADLATEYGVSRSTVRSALQQLETQGLTITRHGMGTFVSPYGRAITAGMQELRSMSDTIRAHGLTPSIEYRDVVFRGATDVEAEALQVSAGTRVLATERTVLADGIAVAFSYEVIPAQFLPTGLTVEDVNGSLFALLEEAGSLPQTAVAEIHAATGPEIGWGERDPDMVYVYLRQVHYGSKALPVLLSRTYFLEGRFQFSILRVR